ncbi:MAG TPA: trimeric intracellular cation channel family protein [Polyangiales bacterium]|nr:trimeric intracellular cation channel family protein [Polyangiales bacterium]
MLHLVLRALDLGGTFVFAISGAVAGVKRRFDVFGVLVLSLLAGNAGGIARDLLIGSVPPAAIANWQYLGVSVLAGLITFLWYPITDRLRDDVLWPDAVGLAFFAITGTQKSLLYGINPIMAALLGTLSGVGGGMLRDLMVNEIPDILRADLYASAALAGASVIVVAPLLHVPPGVASVIGGVLCLALRFGAIRYGWHLPSAHSLRRQTEPDGSGDGPDQGSS